MPQLGCYFMSLPPSESDKPHSHRTDEPEHGRVPEPTRTPLSDEGAMRPVSIIPVAPVHWRLLAGVLDCMLMVGFSMLLLFKVLLPQEYPAAYSELQRINAESVAAVQAGAEKGELRIPQFANLADHEAIAEMLAYSTQMAGLFMLVYFVLCERFMGGATLGKAIFRLRVISLNTGRGPSVWESLSRNIMKVIFLTLWPLWFVFLFVFANRLRRTAYDWISRTLVVSDTAYVPHLEQPRRSRDEDEDDSF